MKHMTRVLALALAILCTFCCVAEGAWVCRTCETENESDFLFCTGCGSERSNNWICGNCSRENKQEYNFCPACGAKKVEETATAEEAVTAEAEEKTAAEIGNYVTFGTYPQTKSGTDNTPIEWLVLDVQGNKALLISRYGLDAQPYNSKYTDITWEKCTLRTWLNGTFLNKAFSAEEQKAILTTEVDNSHSQCYIGWSTSGGNNTQDMIFLLSYAEASKYFGVTWEGSTKSRVEPTAYAINNGAPTNSSYM